MCIYLCLWMPCAWWHLYVGSPKAGLTSSCDSSDLGSKNWTWVFWKWFVFQYLCERCACLCACGSSCIYVWKWTLPMYALECGGPWLTVVSPLIGHLLQTLGLALAGGMVKHLQRYHISSYPQADLPLQIHYVCMYVSTLLLINGKFKK